MWSRASGGATARVLTPGQLTGFSRVLATVTPCACAIGVLLLSTELGKSLPAQAREWAPTVEAVFFVIVCGALMAPVGRYRMRSAIALGLVSLVTLFAGIWAMGSAVRISDRTWTTGVFFSAFAEEAVFRGLLPLAIARGLQAEGAPLKRLGAVIGSQVVFAFAHYLPLGSGVAVHPASDLLRLFVFGLTFAGIASEFGIGIAAAVHALTNIAISTDYVLASDVGMGRLALASVGVVAVVSWRAMHLGRRAPSHPRDGETV